MSLLATAIEVVEGRAVRVARLGDGSAGPPIVLLHGYPDNLQIWSELAPRLAGAGHRVIAFDWPGLGDSAQWPGGATPLHFAERLRVLLTAWGLPRVVLMGADMGGQPALTFAAREPERVAALVVMNSLVLGDAPTSWEIRVLRQHGWNQRILLHLPRLVLRRAERTFLPPGTRLPRELARELWRTFARRSVRAYVVRMCAGYEGFLPRLPDLYRVVSAPVLALWGDAEHHFPPAQAERLCALLPCAQLDVVKDGHHWMMLHAPDVVAARASRFLETL